MFSYFPQFGLILKRKWRPRAYTDSCVEICMFYHPGWSFGISFGISSVQFSHSAVSDFLQHWMGAYQASLSITNSRSLLKPLSIESVKPSNHFILQCPLLLLPSIFLSIRVFSNESVLCNRFPKYWSFSFSISFGIAFIFINQICFIV